MASWSAIEWITYGCIAIAALMPAIAIAVSAEPALMRSLARIIESRWWRLSPAIAIVISVILVSLNQLGVIGSDTDSQTASSASWLPPAWFCLVLAIVAISLWASRYLPSQTASPDWSIWQQMSSWNMREFSMILARRDPTAKGTTQEEATYFTAIQEAINAGDLPHIGQEPITWQTRIKAADAIKWAEAHENFDVSHVRPRDLRPFALQNFFAYTNQAPNITFHHKAYVVVRNDSALDIKVGTPEWRAKVGDIEPLHSQHPWVLKQGNNFNGPESSELVVPPGRAARTWFAFPNEMACEQVTNRLIADRVGTVVVSMTVNGRVSTQEIRLRSN